MVLRLRNRACLGKEQSILAPELLVGALQIQLQLEIVTDILLFFDYQIREYRLTNILLYMQGQPKEHIVFIRHGESQKNAAVVQFFTERGYPNDWNIFGKDPDFKKLVTFNPDLIDCHLSPTGRQQCLEAKEKMKDFNPDLIICSPLQRALQTLRIVFPNAKCPHIVEPLLSQTFKHSSQVCRSIQVKKAEFKEFDFSKVEAQGEFWFIKNDSIENQQKYFKFLEEIHFEGIEYKEKAAKIAQFMDSQKLRETTTNVRERARKVKDLLRDYSQKYQRIAVVSHFFTIKFLNATEFNENDEPVNKVHMGNCGIFATSLAELSKNN